MNETIIARALHSILVEHIDTSSRTRRFFRLDGFSDIVYQQLLSQLQTAQATVAGKPVLIRTVAPIAGCEAYALEADKSPTWYRNNVPNGHALLLIFNQLTSDAQSLKSIYPITESSLVETGLSHLLQASFTNYQLKNEQKQTIIDFLRRFRQQLFSPPLSSSVAFLDALHNFMQEQPGHTISAAIADKLPHLGLFRCQELADKLNTSKGDRLLLDVFKGAELEHTLLDYEQQRAYLERLEEIVFEDDRPYGFAATEKKKLLSNFITNVTTDRSQVAQVFQLDWSEVKGILQKGMRKTPEEKLKDLAVKVVSAFTEQEIDLQMLSDPVQEALQTLAAGKKPNENDLDTLLSEQGEYLPAHVKKQVRQLRGAYTVKTEDFLAGLMDLAVQLIEPREANAEKIQLVIAFHKDTWQEQKKGKNKDDRGDALLAFRILYGGIEQRLPLLNWQLKDLWSLADQQHQQTVDQNEDGDPERMKEVIVPFSVTMVDGNQKPLAHADLLWRYRSDSPAAATVAHLYAEANQLPEVGSLFALDAKLRIPLYNNCRLSEEIGDLDLSRPLKTLGAWYGEDQVIDNLHDKLNTELRPKLHQTTWELLSSKLQTLERTWANFVQQAVQEGLLAAELQSLLTAYENLIEIALTHLQQEVEALYAFRLLTQAWVIGPPEFHEWAVVPLLHPLKLHWQHARAIRFNALLARLLSTTEPVVIVNERRFRQEIQAIYGSAGLPAVIALPNANKISQYFLPVHEVHGYELYRLVGKASIAYGLDPLLSSAEESERSATVSAGELAAVIQDYLETYPFARDGLELYLVECRNGALPALLVEKLQQALRNKQHPLRMNVIIHSKERGAPLYQRVQNWLTEHEEFSIHPAEHYFPTVTFKVLQSDFDELYKQLDDTDLVILPDVLAEQGQTVITEFQPSSTGEALNGYLPLYSVQQAPFQRGELSRTLLLTQPNQPGLFQQFYNLQWAAHAQKPLITGTNIEFRQQVTLQAWHTLLTQLHEHFNWVVCYDPTVDRFLLETTLPNAVEVIRYSLGLGAKNRHHLTVSSSRRAQSLVIQRLAENLRALLPNAPVDFRQKIANQLVTAAKAVSGDIVLRAAGPGAYLNELIGMVAAKHLTERRYLTEHPGALTTWIYLDDFAHWFDHRVPDLIFIAIPPNADGALSLHIELLETKCVGEASFSAEAKDAQQQVAQGINRLAQAWAPNAKHLDASYWYYQLYQAFVSNLIVEREQRPLWEIFRTKLLQGDFDLKMSGHSWVFCHNGTVGIKNGKQTGNAAIRAQDVVDVPHQYHHYSRATLRKVLQELVEDSGQIAAPAAIWADEELISTIPPLPTNVVARTETIVLSAPIPSHVETPPIQSLLTAQPALNLQDVDLSAWLTQKSQELMRALRDYNIQVRSIDLQQVDIGPSVVRFKIELYPGERGNRLQTIAGDLQRVLALTAAPIIDNVRGTKYIGIDLPHPQPMAVPLLPELETLQQRGATVGQLLFVLGKGPDGKIEIVDLATLPHLLVAGSTGSGKTIFLYSLILSLIAQFSSKQLVLLLVDPKQTDFVYFEQLPHLMSGQTIIEPEVAIQYLETLTTETLPERTRQLRSAGCRDIHDYNARHPQDPIEPIVVIIDEYADLVQVLPRNERQNFEGQLIRLAQRARSVGIHLVIATQRPTGDIVTTNLKTNLPGRIAFRLPSHHDSMTILDQSGAENLLGRGDMLFFAGSEMKRLQALHIDTVSLQNYLRQYVL